jgi:5-methyltetrahydropteroyltriglutamate--homocysteine methyltransferase
VPQSTQSDARPPFRADHVGSFLRPARLRAAIETNSPALAAIQDECVREIVRMQEAAGLSLATDGEFRHESWHNFLENLEGVRVIPPVLAGPGSKSFVPRSYRIEAKLRHVRPIEVANFKFLQSVTGVTPKVTLASPTMLMRAGREGISTEAYPDLEEFFADAASVYRTEIRLLVEAGCRYVQIDDTNFAYLCDPNLRERLGGEALAKRYVALINRAISECPDSVTKAVHVCRGNAAGTFAATGGYEPIAEVLLSELNVDGYFLEYDDERSGGFEPLRFLPKNSQKRIVLGLVSSKRPELESKDELKRRIDEAARFVPLENLCLSPQCGFSSTLKGTHPVPEDGQRRKLELIVATACEVWGSAP